VEQAPFLARLVLLTVLQLQGLLRVMQVQATTQMVVLSLKQLLVRMRLETLHHKRSALQELIHQFMVQQVQVLAHLVRLDLGHQFRDLTEHAHLLI
jgi:hypothetical protein